MFLKKHMYQLYYLLEKNLVHFIVISTRELSNAVIRYQVFYTYMASSANFANNFLLNNTSFKMFFFFLFDYCLLFAIFVFVDIFWACDGKNTIKFRDCIDFQVINRVINIGLYTIWVIRSQNFVWR